MNAQTTNIKMNELSSEKALEFGKISRKKIDDISTRDDLKFHVVPNGRAIGPLEDLIATRPTKDDLKAINILKGFLLVW